MTACYRCEDKPQTDQIDQEKDPNCHVRDHTEALRQLLCRLEGVATTNLQAAAIGVAALSKERNVGIKTAVSELQRRAGWIKTAMSADQEALWLSITKSNGRII